MKTHLENDLPDDIFEVRVPIRLCYLGGNHYDSITKDEDRERLKELASAQGAKARIIRKHRRAKISDYDAHPLQQSAGGGGGKGRGGGKGGGGWSGRPGRSGGFAGDETISNSKG
jgi:hypothetical protein